MVLVIDFQNMTRIQVHTSSADFINRMNQDYVYGKRECKGQNKARVETWKSQMKNKVLMFYEV